MTDTRGMIEAYAEVVEQEALQKGRQEGVLRTIEGLLGRNVPWATITAATGIDEAEFRRLRQQPDSAVGDAAEQVAGGETGS